MSIDVNVQNDLVIVTESSEDITVNVSNAAGADGVGVPTGGSTGQVLKKLSNTDYDTYWALDGGGVPYSGATSDVNLGEFGLSAGQLTLDTSPTGTAAVGTTRWNDTIGSSETTLKGGSVILKNGVDLVARVVNKVSPNTTLTKAAYQAVRVSGAQGQRLAVALAQANNDANSADTIGLVTETIATNQEGFIITVGQLENINTTGSLQGETWVDGDVLYLSPTTPGAITKVKPTGNGHIVVIGYVEYAHANNGKIYVKVMNGWELTELHDCDIVTPANNEALIYESSTQLWKNKTIASALGYTPISGTGVSGQVAFWNGTNSQTGSNNLFWDAANSRLGIGLTNPSYGLDVSSSVRFSNSSAMSTGYSFGVQRLQFNNGVAGGNIGVIRASTNGIIILNNAAELDFNRLCFGAASTSFPALQRSGVALCVVDGAGGTLGNLLLGGTTDGGQRLQVYGNAFIKGSGATSATTALTIQDSGGLNLFRVRNDGLINIGTVSGETFIAPTTNGTTVNKDGRGLIFNAAGIIGVQAAFTFSNSMLTQGGYVMRLLSAFTANQGLGDTTFLWITPNINQTGTATHITRGLYVNPTLTAAADWRSIEWSNNSGWGLYGAGNANNYLGGRLGIQSTDLGSYVLHISNNISGAVNSYGVILDGNFLSDVTSGGWGYTTLLGTQATTFTMLNLWHFRATQRTFGAGSTVTNQYGFAVRDNLTGATNNFGFYGDIPNAANRWNLYMNGTADNYLRGKLLINTTTVGTYDLDVNGTARVSGNMAIRTTIPTTVHANTAFLFVGNSAAITSSTNSNDIALNNNSYYDGTNNIYRNNGSATSFFQDSAGIRMFTAPSGTAGNSVTFTENLRLLNNGNLQLQTGGTYTDIASAKLAINSTTQGFLPPRMTTTQKNAIATPAAGLQVYDTTLNQMSYYNGTTWVNF